MSEDIHITTVKEMMEDINLKLQSGYKVRMATSSEDRYHILSIYPDKDAKTIWIDIERTPNGDKY